MTCRFFDCTFEHTTDSGYSLEADRILGEVPQANQQNLNEEVKVGPNFVAPRVVQPAKEEEKK